MSSILRTHPSIPLPGVVPAIVPGYKFGAHYVVLQDFRRTWGIVRTSRGRNPTSLVAIQSDGMLLSLKLLAMLWERTGSPSPEQMWADLVATGFPTDDLLDCMLRRKFMDKAK